MGVFGGDQVRVRDMCTTCFSIVIFQGSDNIQGPLQIGRDGRTGGTYTVQIVRLMGRLPLVVNKPTISMQSGRYLLEGIRE